MSFSNVIAAGAASGAAHYDGRHQCKDVKGMTVGAQRRANTLPRRKRKITERGKSRESDKQTIFGDSDPTARIISDGRVYQLLSLIAFSS